jgi:predicted GIY-YIG superfamily endonuclease
MFWVYVLRSEASDRRYSGSCEDFDGRLQEHNSGRSPAKRYGVPWRLMHRESFSTR